MSSPWELFTSKGRRKMEFSGREREAVVVGGEDRPSGRPERGPCICVMLRKYWTGHLPSLGTQMPKEVLGKGGDLGFHL